MDYSFNLAYAEYHINRNIVVKCDSSIQISNYCLSLIKWYVVGRSFLDHGCITDIPGLIHEAISKIGYLYIHKCIHVHMHTCINRLAYHIIFIKQTGIIIGHYWS